MNDPISQIKNLISGELGFNLSPDPFLVNGMDFTGPP